MSHSTSVTVTVANTTVSYIFGSGALAQGYGVTSDMIGKPKVIRGEEAIQILKDAPPLPHHHMVLVNEELAELVYLYKVAEDTGWEQHVSISITRFDRGDCHGVHCSGLHC